MKRSVTLRPVIALSVALAAFVGPTAQAQDTKKGDDPPVAAENDERIDRLVRGLNIPALTKKPELVAARVRDLLASRHPRAYADLRARVLRTSEKPVIVLEIARAILADPDAGDLLDALVERLRVERGSGLSATLAGPLRNVDAPVLARLAEFARARGRAPEFRSAAIDVLGRTGREDALPLLLDLWGGPDELLREPARRAFVGIAPVVGTLAEARAMWSEMNDGPYPIPLNEMLRRRIREQTRELATHSDSDQQDLARRYRETAERALPHLPLTEILAAELLESPVTSLRIAAAKRLAGYPFDRETDGAAARQAAGKALFTALRHEDDAEAERAVLAALAPLASVLRDNVNAKSLRALLQRAIGPDVSRDIRSQTLALLGALKEKRAIAPLQKAYDELADTDPEMRQEILGTLEETGSDLTSWLIVQVNSEGDERIVKKIVAILGRTPRPEAISAFTRLLQHSDDDEVREFVATSLGNIWVRLKSEDALRALVEHGLTDASTSVRRATVRLLGNRIPEGEAVVLPALKRVAHDKREQMSVRTAAAEALRSFAGLASFEHLVDVLDVEAIWAVYADLVKVELARDPTLSAQVIGQARQMWDTGSGPGQARAVALLREVIGSRDGLWETGEGRGLFREQLAEWLIESGKPPEAAAVAQELLDAEGQTEDPRARWELLTARALRRCRTDDSQTRCQTMLASLAAAELPADLRARVYFELGLVQLERGDPTAALGALDEVDREHLPVEHRSALTSSKADARRASEEEHARVIALVEVLGTGTPEEAEAETSLKGLGQRAMRHVYDALDQSSTDAAYQRRLLRAASLLLGVTISPDEDTPEKLAEAVSNAKAGLEKVMRSRRSGSR